MIKTSVVITVFNP